MRYIKKKTIKKHTTYTYDGHFLQVRFMEKAVIEELEDGYYGLTVIMLGGKEHVVMDSIRRSYLEKECRKINEMIRRQND